MKRNSLPPLQQPRRLAARTGFRLQLTLWFAGLSLVTLGCVGVYLGTMLTHGLVSARSAALSANARFAAELLDTNLRERELDIRLLSSSVTLTEGSLSRELVRKTLDRRMAAHAEYAWIGIADLQGTVVQASGGALVGQQVSERPWFKGGLQGPYAGDVHEAVLLARILKPEPGGEPLRFVDFSAPVRSPDGTLIGVLGAHVHWNWVRDTVEAVVQRADDNDGLEVLLADRAGNVIYPLPLVGQVSVPVFPRGVKRSGVMEWNDGREYLTSIATVAQPALGWQIVLRQPAEVAFGPVRALQWRLAMFGVVAALLFSLLAYRFAVRLSRPLEQLAGAVRKIERQGRVDHGELVVDSVSEIRDLGSAIVSMTDSLLQKEDELERLNNSLEAQVISRTAELTEANAALARLATHDGLTGLFNRRRFDEALREHFLLQRRTGQPFAVMLIDADHFKTVNDTWGHPTGDAVLRQLADILREHTRQTDFVARYGGEEFILLLAGTGQEDEIRHAGERIRRAVEDATFPGVGKLSVSLGSSCPLADDADESQVVERADRALYVSKTSGRNRLSLA